MKTKYIIAILVFVCCGCVYFACWSEKTVEPVLEIVSEATNGTVNETIINESVVHNIFVYVCGCVNNPGVYELPEGSRMFEAVEMAGGVCEEGCVQYMEMAANLYDGQRIYIPSVNEAQHLQLSEDNKELGLTNLNTATKSQLMELPGVGEAKAEAIIAYRNEHGNFESIEDVMKISGIKEAAFSKMKAFICVN